MTLTQGEYQELQTLKNLFLEKYGTKELYLVRSTYTEDFLSLVEKLNIQKINKGTYVIHFEQLNSVK